MGIRFEVEGEDKIKIKEDTYIVRTIKKEEAVLVLEYFIRNRKFLERYSPKADESFFSEVSIHEKKSEVDEINFENKLGLRLWIFNKKETEIIGSIGFSNIVYGAFRSCHLGYHIDSRYEGKKIMKNSINKGIDFVFTEWELHRIEANIIPRNKKSRHLANALGMKREGLAKKYLKINGTWEDHIHYVLLNEAIE